MHGDDLDAAWRDALRRDMAKCLGRVADHVVEPQVAFSGTPWRMTGWLTRR